MAIILHTEAIWGQTYRGFLEQTLFTALAAAMPEEPFICTTPGHLQGMPPNIKPGGVFPETGIFKNRKTERWLEENEATVYISFSETIKTKKPIKQILIISNPEAIKSGDTLVNADAVGFTSSYLKKKFEKDIPAFRGKRFLMEGTVQVEELKLTARENQQIKEELTEGREFFIMADFDLTKEKFISVLKSFSVFKRMQQSHWKLVIVWRDEKIKSALSELLLHYKYKEDVILTDASMLREKMAAAYALVSAEKREISPVSVVEAIALGTPVIAVPTTTLKEMYGDAIVYAANNSFQAVGDMMMMIYKGENFRQNLIKQIATFDSAQFDISHTVDELKHIITA